MAGYVKLFSSILDSTVWDTPPAITKVWLTLMAMADRDGIVTSSVPGLAQRARVDLETTETALSLFMSPDKYSKTKDFEGRRIEEVDGGWRLLNYLKHRESLSTEHSRAKNAERQKRWREKDKDDHGVTPVTPLRNASSRSVTPSNPIADPTAEAYASPEADLDPNVAVDPDVSVAETAQTPSSPNESPLLTFPCDGDPDEWHVTWPQVRRWRELFPSLDIGSECRAALAWIEANPESRKTAKGMTRFLVRWFGRSQNEGRGKRSASGTRTRQDDMVDAGKRFLDRHPDGSV